MASTIEERAKARRDKVRKPEDTKVSPTEPESMSQPLKTGGVAPSYKPSVLANDKRVIVGVGVDASNEVSVVPAIITQAEQIGDQTPSQAMFDGNYDANIILEMAIEKDIDILIAQGSNDDGRHAPSKTPKKFPKTLLSTTKQQTHIGAPRERS